MIFASVAAKAFLSRYWKVIAVVAVLGSAVWLYEWRIREAELRGYRACQAEVAIDAAKANKRAAEIDAENRKKSDAAAAAWSVEREELQGQVVGLLARGVSIRVCKSAPSGGQLPRPGDPTGRAPDTAERPIDAVPAGPDIGGELVQYGGDCERYRTQLRALINWYHSIE